MMKHILIGGTCVALLACGSKEPVAPQAQVIETAPVPKPIVRILRGGGKPLNFSATVDKMSLTYEILQAVDESAYIPGLSSETGLAKGDGLDAAARKLGDFFGPESNGGYGFERIVLRVPKDNGETIIIAQQYPLKDAYIEEEHVLMIFAPNENGRLVLDRFGRSVVCKLGDTDDQQTTPCPQE